MNWSYFEAHLKRYGLPKEKSHKLRLFLMSRTLKNGAMLDTFTMFKKILNSIIYLNLMEKLKFA